jgi:hypothetical protein
VSEKYDGDDTGDYIRDGDEGGASEEDELDEDDRSMQESDYARSNDGVMSDEADQSSVSQEDADDESNHDSEGESDVDSQDDEASDPGMYSDEEDAESENGSSSPMDDREDDSQSPQGDMADKCGEDFYRTDIIDSSPSPHPVAETVSEPLQPNHHLARATDPAIESVSAFNEPHAKTVADDEKDVEVIEVTDSDDENDTTNHPLPLDGPAHEDSDASSEGPVTPPSIARCLKRTYDELEDQNLEATSPKPAKAAKPGHSFARSVGLVVLGAALGSVGTIAGLMRVAAEDSL